MHLRISFRVPRSNSRAVSGAKNYSRASPYREPGRREGQRLEPAELKAEEAAPQKAVPETQQGLHRFVIVGGGAGGLELATGLGEMLGKRNRAHITLVDKLRTHLWKPLLHAVAAGSMDPSEEELNYLAQAHWRHFDYRIGEMVGLDRAAKLAHLAAPMMKTERKLRRPEACHTTRSSWRSAV